jgi:hypothetical protein
MYEGLVPCPHRTVDDGGRILCGLIKGGDREVSVNLCRACPVPQINCQHLRAAMQKKVSTPITVRYATGRVEVWDDEGPTIGFKQAACAVKTMPIHSVRDCTGCPLRVPQVVPVTAIQVARSAKSMQPLISPVMAVSAVAAENRRTPPPSNSASYTREQATPAKLERARGIVQRGHALAAKDSREPAQGAAAPRRNKSERAAPAEPVSKIILLQQWLADQLNKKNADPRRSAPPPDEDEVKEMVYSPIAPASQEEAGHERCVGWTD